jgi:hypothetical protein
MRTTLRSHVIGPLLVMPGSECKARYLWSFGSSAPPPVTFCYQIYSCAKHSKGDGRLPCICRQGLEKTALTSSLPFYTFSQKQFCEVHIPFQFRYVGVRRSRLTLAVFPNRHGTPPISRYQRSRLSFILCLHLPFLPLRRNTCSGSTFGRYSTERWPLVGGEACFEHCGHPGND